MILEKLGVRRWINAANWATTIGGSSLPQRVVEAIAEVADVWVDMYELLDKAGKEVARLCDADTAYITSGAAAAIELSVAASIAKKSKRLWESLPHAGGEVVLARSHYIPYSSHWLTSGAKLVEYGNIGFGKSTQDDIVSAVSMETSCLGYVDSIHVDPRHVVLVEDVIDVAHRHNLPVIVDAASSLPPVKNLWKYTDLDADLTVFGAGRSVRAMSSTGFVLGNGKRGKSLIEAMYEYGFPTPGWGRSRKVSKEQIVALVAALEFFIEEGDSWYEEQMEMAKEFATKLEKVPGIEVTIIPNDDTLHEHPSVPFIPRVKIEWDVEDLGITSSDVKEKMEAEDPPILIETAFYSNCYSDREWCLIDTYNLHEDEKETVITRLKRSLRRKK